MPAFGPFYPPFLQEAVNHTERLVDVLEALDPTAARRSATTWLLGRVEEVECLVGELTAEWKRGEMSEPDATQAVNSYVQALHRGLAINFGELAPCCCVSSMIITATPASFLSVTASFPPSIDAGHASVGSTWAEVMDAEIVDATYSPSSR
jgi:hypothetical protein